jgi:hypothetical protein
MEEPTFIKTGKKEFDELYPRIKAFLLQDSLDMEIDGEKIRGYRSPDSRAIWIRDHSDILRGAKYIEKDMKSAVEHFAATQAANGRIFDYFTIYPDKLSCQKENWTKYVRVPVEADVEYRFIKAKPPISPGRRPETTSGSRIFCLIWKKRSITCSQIHSAGMTSISLLKEPILSTPGILPTLPGKTIGWNFRSRIIHSGGSCTAITADTMRRSGSWSFYMIFFRIRSEPNIGVNRQKGSGRG